MDFDDTPDEASFRREVRDWIAANAPRELADELRLVTYGSAVLGGRADAIDRFVAWQEKKQASGYACPHWPREYGGGGFSPMERVIWNQEEGIYAALSNIFVIGIGMCGPTLIAWATEEQKEYHLPRIASGSEIWCQLFSEPSAGSDLAGLRTRAERAADGTGDWIVNGQKVWTSVAQHADYGLLVARTDPAVAKHKGLTMFFLDMATPGVEVRPIRQVNGRSQFNEVFFTDVRIPDAQRLGAVGQGWEVSLTTLMNERMGIGAGMSTGFPALLAYCEELVIDGRPVIEDRAVRSRLAEFAVRESGLRYSGWRAISALSKGEQPGPENSIGKLVGASGMQEIAAFAMDLQGQAGVLAGADADAGGRFQALFLRAPGSRIEGGSDEILRNIIAERVLGLPPEIRVDKTVPFKDIPARGGR